MHCEDTDILNCHFSASDDGGEEDTDLCRNLVHFNENIVTVSVVDDCKFYIK